MKKMMKRMIAVAFACFCGVVASLTTFLDAPKRVYAATENAFDKTKVEDDLKDFDFSSVKLDKTLDPSVLYFMEYGYTSDVNKSANYGLYVYVLNPAQTEYSPRSGANTITLANSFDENGEGNDYKSFSMAFCGATAGNIKHVVYKYRVEGLDASIKEGTDDSFYDLQCDYEDKYGYRRYEVGAMHLYPLGGSGAKSYSVGRTYKYEGYAVGGDKSAATDSTLKCEWEQLETVELKVYPTYYRLSEPYEESYGDKGYHAAYGLYEEVESVYFAIPKRLLDDYGSLQKIKAEWYEYKTKPVFVTSDDGAYNKDVWHKSVFPIGEDIGEKKDDLKWRVMWNETQYSPVAGTTSYTYRFNSTYNRVVKSDSSGLLTPVNYYWDTADVLTQMDWFFYDEKAETKGNTITRDTVRQYMEDYTTNFSEQERVGRGEQSYAVGLFADTVDEGAKRGYNEVLIEADSETSLEKIKDQSFWEHFLGKKKKTETATTYEAIVSVPKEAADYADTLFKETFLTSSEDVATFKKFVKNTYDGKDVDGKALSEASVPYTFRFANRSYYYSEARFDLCGNGKMSDIDGYVAQSTMFLDFTVISLTFRKGDKDTVLAVVSDPIDVFGGFTTQTDLTRDNTKDGNWSLIERLFTVFLSIMMIVLLFVVLCLIFPGVFSAAVSLLGVVFSFLFKVIAAPFRWINKALRKKE